MSKKLEQKQRRRQAEEQRKRELQRAARRRNLITIGIIVLVAAIVVGAIYYQRRSESGPVGVAADTAGCGEIERPDELGADHVPDGQVVEYNTDPPTSGPHYQVPAEPGFYPPGALDQIPRERFVHNLEHGQIVIWYRPDAPQRLVDDLESYVDKQSGRQSVTLLAEPYEGVDSQYSFTMTAWGASQSCEQLSEEVVGGFREEFQGRGPENPRVEMATFDFERDG